jgi:hypothetical protein
MKKSHVYPHIKKIIELVVYVLLVIFTVIFSVRHAGDSDHAGFHAWRVDEPPAISPTNNPLVSESPARETAAPLYNPPPKGEFK